MMKFNDIKMQTSNMWYLYTVFIRLTTLGAHLRLGTLFILQQNHK